MIIVVDASQDLLLEAIEFYAAGDTLEDIAFAERYRAGQLTDADWEVIESLAETLAVERGWDAN